MDQYRAIQVFTEVAAESGFAAAARKLDISTSAASRYVAQLEDWLGQRLLHRTTRHLKLTQAGIDALPRLEQILSDLDKMRALREDEVGEPSGNLRVTAPVYLSKYWLTGILADYMQQFPRVNFELVVSDRSVNLVSEGFDLAIRAGNLQDSTLVSRKLGNSRVRVVASPRYLEANGIPSTPDQLTSHDCIVDTVPSYGERWPLNQPSRKQSILGNRKLLVNSGEIARDLAIAGLGITCLPEFIVSGPVKEQQLVCLLDEYLTRNSGIYVIYPTRHHVSANVRSFVDFLTSQSPPGNTGAAGYA